MSEKSFVRKLNRMPARTLITLALLVSALLLAIASPALAGGFQLSIETPAGSADPQLKDVVLVARTYGCHQPADAKLSATAEGIVNGKRKSMPLELRSIGSGVYAIKQEWPSEGTWVLALTGAYNGMVSSVLIELGPNGTVLPGTRLDEGKSKGVHARGARRSWIAADIDSALKAPAGTTSQTQGQAETSMLSSVGPLGLLVGGFGASLFTMAFVARSRRVRAARQIPG